MTGKRDEKYRETLMEKRKKVKKRLNGKKNINKS